MKTELCTTIVISIGFILTSACTKSGTSEDKGQESLLPRSLSQPWVPLDLNSVPAMLENLTPTTARTLMVDPDLSSDLRKKLFAKLTTLIADQGVKNRVQFAYAFMRQASDSTLVTWLDDPELIKVGLSELTRRHLHVVKPGQDDIVTEVPEALIGKINQKCLQKRDDLSLSVYFSRFFAVSRDKRGRPCLYELLKRGQNVDALRALGATITKYDFVPHLERLVKPYLESVDPMTVIPVFRLARELKEAGLWLNEWEKKLDAHPQYHVRRAWRMALTWDPLVKDDKIIKGMKDPVPYVSAALGAETLWARPNLSQTIFEIFESTGAPEMKTSLLWSILGFKKEIQEATVQKYIEDPNPSVRSSAIQALSKFDSETSEVVIRNALVSQDFTNVSAAVTAFGVRSSPDMLKWFVAKYTQILGAEFAEVRAQMLRLAQREIGAQSKQSRYGFELLELGLKDSYPPIQFLAYRLLKFSGKSPARPVLDPQAKMHLNDFYPNETAKPQILVLHTSRGTFKFELLSHLSPMTLRSISTWVRGGRWNGTRFNLIMPGEYIMSGGAQNSGFAELGQSPFYLLDTFVEPENNMLWLKSSKIPGVSSYQFYITYGVTRQIPGSDFPIGRMIQGKELLTALQYNDQITGASISP